MDFSQATPPTTDSTHSHSQPPPVDVKEMNFDPLVPNSSSGGLLDRMEIHHHSNPPAPLGNISVPPSLNPNHQTSSSYQVNVCISVIKYLPYMYMYVYMYTCTNTATHTFTTMGTALHTLPNINVGTLYIQLYTCTCTCAYNNYYTYIRLFKWAYVYNVETRK